MSDLSRIKDRVRKLLNLAADDGAADGEIDNALRAARELMLAHQLSEDDVSAPPEDLRTPEEIAKATEYGIGKSWASGEKAPRWQGTLATAVADFLGTVNVYRDSNRIHRAATGIVINDGKTVTGWVFYGPADDSDFASELHQELMLTCATTAKLKFGGSLMSGAGRDYCDGFARGLYNKVQDAKLVVQKQEQQDAPRLNGQQCTALSIVRAGEIAQAKRDHARDWLKQEKGVTLGRAGGGYGRSIGDSGAYEAGRADGQSQSLTRNRVARIG